MRAHRFVEPTPTGAERVEIVVAGWEIECCAPPPVVGEPTSWMLEFQPGDADLDHEFAWDATRWDERVTCLRRGPVTAYWAFGAGSPPAPGTAVLRGRLCGTVHGGISPDGFPACRGRVDRVRVLSQRYREVTERTWEGVPGTVAAVDVAQSPRWFHGGPLDGTTSVPFGVLVDVRIESGLPGDRPG